METKIAPCKCSGTPAASYQDEVYGRGNRVHNLGLKGKTETRSLTCTVCGTKK